MWVQRAWMKCVNFSVSDWRNAKWLPRVCKHSGYCDGLAHPTRHHHHHVYNPRDAGVQYSCSVFYLDMCFVPFSFNCSVTEHMSLITHLFVPVIYFAVQILKAFLLSGIWNCVAMHVASTHWLVQSSYSSALSHLLESPHVVTVYNQIVSLTSSGLTMHIYSYVFYQVFTYKCMSFCCTLSTRAVLTAIKK